MQRGGGTSWSDVYLFCFRGGRTLDAAHPFHFRDLKSEVRPKDCDVRAVDEQVCAEFMEARELLDAAGEMNPRADARRARLAEDRLARGEEFRPVIFLRHPKAAREVVRADEHGVEVGHGEDFIERAHGGRALDVDDERLGVALAEIIFERRLEWPA